MTAPSAESTRSAYEAVFPERELAARKLNALLEDLLGEQNCHDITARAKGIGSYCTKAQKTDNDGAPKYDDPIHQIKDQVAARVITYLDATVADVCTILGAEFDITEDEDKGATMRREGRFGYASRHLLLRLNPTRTEQPEYRRLAGLEFEVQVRTLPQHAWAEFEHDVRYKYAIPPDRKPEFDRSFALAAALLEMADREFTVINGLFHELARDTPTPATEVTPLSMTDEKAPLGTERADAEPTAIADRQLTSDDLLALLAKRYPAATRSRKAHYASMVRVLANLGIATRSDLNGALDGVDSSGVAAAMDHQLPAGHVRRLEDDLLCRFGPRYLEASRIDDLAGREGILHARLEKVRKLRN